MKHSAVPAASLAAMILATAIAHAASSGPPPLKPAWRTNLSDTGFFLRYAPSEPTGPVAGPEGLSVVVGASDGLVRRVGAQDGRELWSTDVGGGPQGRMTVAGGRVVLASDDGYVLALDLSTGKEIWRERAGGAVVAGPVVARGRALFVTDEDTLRVLDVDTGKWRWDYTRETPEGFVLFGAAEPVVHGEHVLMGYADGSLVSLLFEDGSLVWRQDLTGGATEFTDVDTRPLVHDGRVFAASYEGGVHCLSIKDGEILWRAADVRGARTPSFHQSRDGGFTLLTPTATGDLIGLDASDGRVRYRKRLTAEGSLGELVRVGPWWAAPSSALGILLLDGDTGHVVQRLDGGFGVSATPAVVRGKLFMLSNGGWLYAFLLG